MFTWQDLSNWQAGQKVTGPIVAKAGEGLDFTDSTYSGFCAEASVGGFPAFGYYALHTSATVQQAQRAAAIIGTRPAMFDVERWPQESGSPAGIVNLGELLAAVDTYRAVGGVMHVNYLPRSQWEAMGSPDLAPLAARGISILNADYNAGAEDPTSPAWEPYGGMHPVGVQYAPEHNATQLLMADWVSLWQYGHLSVPAPAPAPAPGSTYVVQEGDTLSSIAAKFGLTLAHLEATNPHAGHPAGSFDLIWPGDRLVITDKIGNPSPTPPVAAPQPPRLTYTVRAGDTLSSIAYRNRMTLPELEAMNPHAGHPAGHFDLIWPGDHLAVKA